MTITWDTDAGAPCCAGRIVADDGRDILIQSDRDWPGVAETFGWSMRSVQFLYADGHDNGCHHAYTDGSLNCGCGVSVHEFIRAAGEYLDGADGATADDPGYFGEGGAP